ncbi:MAG: putative FmdB family regulatory protein [Desulforhopalus sp.]|jgi:putative FmdB family regulatory protein
MIMPIYEYKCNECDTEFELLTTSADDGKEVHCSKCNSENVTKLISAGSSLSGTGTSLAPAGCGGNSGFS